MRKASESENLNQDHLQNIGIFSGIKAFAIIYVMLGVSCIFIWYSYVSDPLRITDYSKNVGFLFVYGTYFTSCVLFMTAGFLQCFTFMQKEDEMFTPKNLLKYYVWRLFKFVPLLATVLTFGFFMMPFIGTGPIWKLYE